MVPSLRRPPLPPARLWPRLRGPKSPELVARSKPRMDIGEGSVCCGSVPSSAHLAFQTGKAMMSMICTTMCVTAVISTRFPQTPHRGGRTCLSTTKRRTTTSTIPTHAETLSTTGADRFLPREVLQILDACSSSASPCLLSCENSTSFFVRLKIKILR